MIIYISDEAVEDVLLRVSTSIEQEQRLSPKLHQRRMWGFKSLKDRIVKEVSATLQPEIDHQTELQIIELMEGRR